MSPQFSKEAADIGGSLYAGADFHKLSLAHKILSGCGHDDLTLGHVALRDRAGAGFWIKRANVGLGEVEGPEDYLLMSFEGVRLAGEGRHHSEWPLHAELLRARPDIDVSVHTHAEWPTLASAFGAGLRQLTTDAAYLGKVTTFAASKGSIDRLDLGQEVAHALGGQRALLLQNHGTVFVGSSLEQAVVVGYYLNRAARVEVRARALDGAPGLELHTASADRAAMMHDATWLADSFNCLARKFTAVATGAQE